MMVKKGQILNIIKIFFNPSHSHSKEILKSTLKKKFQTSAILKFDRKLMQFYNQLLESK